MADRKPFGSFAPDQVAASSGGNEALPNFKDGSPIGFVEYPSGKKGVCPDCEYDKGGICTHSDSRVKGRQVTARNCCNLFDTAGMKVIV